MVAIKLNLDFKTKKEIKNYYIEFYHDVLNYRWDDFKFLEMELTWLCAFMVSLH
jgi:hypothetical protein